MKITLRTSATTLGKKGDTVTVGKSLAAGLIRKGQAEKAKPKKKQSKEKVETKELKEDHDTK